jgi:hypothetical protein
VVELAKLTCYNHAGLSVANSFNSNTKARPSNVPMIEATLKNLNEKTNVKSSACILAGLMMKMQLAISANIQHLY